MRVVNSRVTINNRTIRNLQRASITALEKTLEAMRTDIVQAQVTPFDTGATQGKDTHGNFIVDPVTGRPHTVEDYSKSREGKVYLVTTSPYARRIYFHPQYNFHKIHNAHAQGKWYEPWITGVKKDFCKKKFRKRDFPRRFIPAPVKKEAAQCAAS